MQVRHLREFADVHSEKLLPDTQLPEITHWLTRYEDCMYSDIHAQHAIHMHTRVPVHMHIPRHTPYGVLTH